MTDEKRDFKTHIKEPRWQQVVSVVIVLAVVGVWVWIVFHAR
jgi:cytoskeletal protein RodZ